MRRTSSTLLVSLAAALVLTFGCARKGNDAQLTTNINAQLYSDAQTKGASVHVAAKDGVVTLTGTAPSDAAHLEAYKIATNTPGVNKVVDQITVQAPEQTAATAPTPEEKPAPEPKREVRREKKPVRRAHREARPVEGAQAAPPPQEPAAAPAPPPSTAPTPPQTAPAASEPPPPPPPQPESIQFPTGTTVEIQTVDPIDSKVNHVGDQFQATLAQPLISGNRVIVHRGANIYLRLISATQAGHYKGRTELKLELVRLEFQGQDYPLVSSTYQAAGGSRGKNTAEKVGGGAVLGAIIGAIAGGGKGAAIGAGVGAAGGGVYQGLTHGKEVRIPAETKLDFRLEQPLDISYLPPGSSQ